MFLFSIIHSHYYRCIGFSKLQLHCQFDARYQKNLTKARVTVFAGLNQVSASLNRFKPHVWQKQVFAGRNPTLVIASALLLVCE